jgi:hypothetical protein
VIEVTEVAVANEAVKLWGNYLMANGANKIARTLALEYMPGEGWIFSWTSIQDGKDYKELFFAMDPVVNTYSMEIRDGWSDFKKAGAAEDLYLRMIQMSDAANHLENMCPSRLMDKMSKNPKTLMMLGRYARVMSFNTETTLREARRSVENACLKEENKSLKSGVLFKEKGLARRAL